MEWLTALMNWVLHIDAHLQSFVVGYGVWVYALLFVIIFAETGLVVMPFLPGDSLLLVVGALAGADLMSYPLALTVLILAAIVGNQTNYSLGLWAGKRVLTWQQSRWFNKRAFDQAHVFYERYGGVTIVLARFMPFLRTFAPFVAGVARMERSRFTFFDVTGALIWVGSLVTLGYLFGQQAWFKSNFSLIIWGILLIPAMLVICGYIKARLSATAPAESMN